MNAWIDCLTYLREGDGMSRFQLAPGEVLNIMITSAEILSREHPELLAAFVECSSAVNDRNQKSGHGPVLVTTFL